MACGPFILLSRSGIVMNGPTPIISSMLAEVAPSRPMPRTRWGDSVGRDGTGYYSQHSVGRAIVLRGLPPRHENADDKGRSSAPQWRFNFVGPGSSFGSARD